MGECGTYLEANIKKLLDVSNKKHIKRFKDLLRVLEAASSDEQGFKKYLKYYLDARRATYKNKFGSSSSSSLDKADISLSVGVSEGSSNNRMSIIRGGGSIHYERGSHPIIQ